MYSLKVNLSHWSTQCRLSEGTSLPIGPWFNPTHAGVKNPELQGKCLVTRKLDFKVPLDILAVLISMELH